MFYKDYKVILEIRPGITDLASIKYRDEASVLGRTKEPEKEYVDKILPEKILLAKEYIKNMSFIFDLTLILKTLIKIV
jgi:lipopolysaccharide/colanic/teichoic acid biosynthesis glycosyltransferase